MKLDIFQIDAFASSIFSGNPAAVIPLYEWLSDETLQHIATENGLSETAFFVRKQEYYELRWFTPACEVDLCGHATLAAAFVLFEFLDAPDDCVVFDTKSGRLFVDNDGGLLSMDFPSWKPKPFQVTERVVQALGARPLELYSSRDFLAVFEHPEQVMALKPDMGKVADLDGLALIATAPGEGDYDFISRCFVPAAGIPEDPVTGSAHCTLVPFWAERLGKKTLTAFQASARGGELFCEDLGDRVKIAGHAVCYMVGTIFLD
ncbi:MAG: PhzF family phenazine biosynthesis protein [Proteobacteria bacterium]|nr:PhzF family phenazine biosynthesis protein [Pseudomonadota bacterium]MBU1612307.1 PhzF family phenazine biosynthesis protein [Pseudomonadota bacterium]